VEFAKESQLWSFSQDGWVCTKCPSAEPFSFAAAQHHASEFHPSAALLEKIALELGSEGPWWLLKPTIKCLLCKSDFTSHKSADLHSKGAKHLSAVEFAKESQLWSFSQDGWVCTKCPSAEPFSFATAQHHASERHPSAALLEKIALELGSCWVVEGDTLTCTACGPDCTFSPAMARRHSNHPVHLKNLVALKNNTTLTLQKVNTHMIPEEVQSLPPEHIGHEGPWWLLKPTIKCLLCKSDFKSHKSAALHSKGAKHLSAVKFAKESQLWSFSQDGWVCTKCPSAEPFSFATAQHHASELHPSAALLEKIALELGSCWVVEGDTLACTACGPDCTFSPTMARRHSNHPVHLSNLVDLKNSAALLENNSSKFSERVKHIIELRQTFWMSTPLSLPEKRDVPPPISVEEKRDLLSSFQSHFNIDTRVFTCACCGCIKFGDAIVAPPHQLLIVDTSFLDKYRNLTSLAKNTFSILNSEGNLFHAIPAVNDNGQIHYCYDCHSCLENFQVPKWCIKSGFDFGKTTGLPPLTFIEKIFIARVRSYNTIVKLKGFQVDQKFSGHYISFPHDGPRSASQLPRRDAMESVQVVFVGSRAEFKSAQNTFSGLLTIRKEPMLAWLALFCEINEFYAGVVINRDFDTSVVKETFLQTAVVADSKTAQRLEGLTKAIAPTHEDEGMSHILVTPKIADVEGFDALQGLMEATRRALPRPTSLEIEERDTNTESPSKETHQTQSTSKYIRVHQDANPVNEFADDHYLMGGGFPWLFMGFNFGVLSTQGAVLSKRFVDYATEWADGRFARDPVWAFVVFNQIQRHSVTQQVATMIKPSSETHLSSTVRVFESEEFHKKLAEAQKNPNTKESLRLQRMLLRIIKTCSSKVPWSEMERRACFPRLISMYQFGGMPSIFYTINPADMDQPHMLRLALYATHGDKYLCGAEFPPDLVARTILYKENPAYCAKVFDMLVRAVLEKLFKVQACGREDKKTQTNEVRGIFGRSFLNFGVVESQGRGSLHIHGLLWTDIESTLLDMAAGGILEPLVANLLDSMCCTVLSDRFTPPEKATRAALMKSPLPGSEEYDRHVFNIAFSQQQHNTHTDTCWKSGEHCRFGSPNELCPVTGAYHLHEGENGLIEAYRPCLARQPTTYTDVGYEEEVSLPVLWRTARLTDADAKVVSFNDVLSAATGSNTAIIFLGAMVMAVSVMFYLLKYLTKPPTGIACAASCLHEALERQKEAVTRGVSRPTEEHQRVRQFLNKFSCRYLAKMEMSGQQTFSCILRHQSSYESHCFAYCSINAAVKLRQSFSHIPDASESGSGTESSGESDVESADGQSANGDDALESDAENESELSEVSFVQPVAFHVGRERQILIRQQEVDYRWRGAELQCLSLYEYTALIQVVPSTDPEPKKTRGAGRKRNLVISFDPKHPRASSHAQQLRSKAFIPILGGKGPPRLSKSARKKRDHANYMATLFIPWGGNNIAFHHTLESWSKWLYRVRNGSQVERALFRCAHNVAHPMETRASTALRLLISRFRFQSADKRSDFGKKYNDKCDRNGDAEAEKRLEELQVAMGEDDPGNSYYGQLSDILEELIESTTETSTISKALIKDEISIVSKTFTSPKFSSPDGDINHLDLTDHHNPYSPEPCQGQSNKITDKFDGDKHRDQRRAFERLFDVLSQDSPAQKLFILVGGPGTGKSVVCQELARLCPRLLCTSTTASTAKRIHPRARTFQSALGTEKRSDEAIAACLASFKQWKIKGLLIDEISMLGCRGNSVIDERCRRITGRTRERYGGLVVIFVGDFYQLPCVRDTPLYSDSIALDGFEFLELNIDLRADGDKLQQRIVKEIRDPLLCREALKAYLSAVKELSADDDKFIDGAPFLVSTNAERCAFTLQLAPRYAEKRGFKCLRFPLRSNKSFNGSAKEFEGFQLFVKGATANIVENDHKGSGLLNGFTAELHSLSYDSQSDLKLAQNAIRDAEGTIVDVPRPTTVNVNFKGIIYALKERERLQASDPFIEFIAVPAFAITLHKAQGFTLSLSVLQLSDRPKAKKGSCGRLTIESVYVAISRSECTQNARIFPSTSAGYRQLLALKPNPKVVAWYENARATGFCTAPQIQKKNPKRRAAETGQHEMNAPPKKIAPKNTAPKLASSAKTASFPPMPPQSISPKKIASTINTAASPPIPGETTAVVHGANFGSMSASNVLAPKVAPPEAAPTSKAFLYLGTRNTGTACHTSSVIAAICAVSTSFPLLQEALSNPDVENTVVSSSKFWRHVSHDHSVPQDILESENHGVFECKGCEDRCVFGCPHNLRGTVIRIPPWPTSNLSMIQKLCLNKSEDKTAALFSLTSQIGLPLPTPEAEHQCAFSVLNLITEAIPVWRELVKFTEVITFTCPLCGKENKSREPRSSYEIQVSESTFTTSFCMGTFCCEADNSLADHVKCSNCEKVINAKSNPITRLFERTVPDVLVAVVQRRQREGGVMCQRPFQMPMKLDTHKLKAVIRHVNDGTHFVTKLLGIDGQAYMADDAHVRPLAAREDGNDTLDFVHFYVRELPRQVIVQSANITYNEGERKRSKSTDNFGNLPPVPVSPIPPPMPAPPESLTGQDASADGLRHRKRTHEDIRYLDELMEFDPADWGDWSENGSQTSSVFRHMRDEGRDE